MTTRTRTGNEEDRTFSSVNVVMMIDEIIRAVRERLSEMLKGKRVGFRRQRGFTGGGGAGRKEAAGADHLL